MKGYLFIAFLAFFVCVSGVFVPPRHNRKHQLLGTKECTYGPSYWCKNLTAAAGCHAVKHCIQTVWIHKQLEPDNSNICQICLDMVKQARDQLESNETQELIKEVFEGTCALIHIKPVVEECDKIADNYIPELIDTLASELNPQVVCSVAGLCNNDKIKQYEEEGEGKIIDHPEALNNCEGCHTVVSIVENKFNKMTSDQVLQGFLEVCGKFGSLSDGCSNIVLTYFTQIYDHLKNHLNPNEVCLMAGECSAQFHTHANVEITPISHIGYVPVNGQSDDLPCDFCKQLVGHLRDLLVANTTEIEFKKVLEGLCNQTKSFQAECLSLVDTYYGEIYNFLVTELNPSEVCVMGGLCPSNKTLEITPIMPLLPAETAEKALEITPAAPKQSEIFVNMANEGSSVQILETPEQAQLPIDLLMPPHTQIMYNSQICVFCEYFLHYLQQEITRPATEEEIKAVIDKACQKLPKSVNTSCVAFVDTYEPALIALLAQEIDPSQICPLIKACPSSKSKDVEIFMHQKGDNGKCPLCLFAVTKLEEMVKDKKTEANIEHALSQLCSKLPSNLIDECNDFVKTYTEELVQMLLADLNPQEVCVYLKLCKDNTPPSFVPLPVNTNFGGDVETNNIPDNTINGKYVSNDEKAVIRDSECVLCEFIMKEIENQLNNSKNENDIITTVHKICNVMPHSIEKECNDYVNQYGDVVIQLLIQALEPSEICSVMKMCKTSIEAVEAEIVDCAFCEAIVYTIDKILDNPRVDHDIVHVLEKTCRALPEKDRPKCVNFIESYGNLIFNLIIHHASKRLICHEIGLCAAQVYRPNATLTNSKCVRGPSYWCLGRSNAESCGIKAVQHCERFGWRFK